MPSDWSGADADAYARSFARLCAGVAPSILERVGRHGSGLRVLDAGTGTGTVATALRDAGHEVVAMDAVPAMVAHARSAHPGLDVRVGVLPRLPLEADGFDAVVASFVVNHVPDPRAALAELVRVARPGAPVVATIWPAEPVGAMNALWNAVVERSGVARPPDRRLAPEHDFPRTAHGLRGLLAGVRLQAVEVVPIEWVFRIRAAELWRAAEGGLATIGAIHAAQDAAGRAALHRAYAEVTAERIAGAPDDGLALPSTALLGVGIAP